MTDDPVSKNRTGTLAWAALIGLFFILFAISGIIGIFLNYSIQKRDFARGHAKLFEENALRFFQDNDLIEKLEQGNELEGSVFDCAINDEYKSFAVFKWTNNWVPLVITSPALTTRDFLPTSIEGNFYRYFGVYFWNGNIDAVLTKTPILYSAFWSKGRLYLLAVEIEYTWLYEHLVFPRRAITLGLIGVIPISLLFALISAIIMNLITKYLSHRVMGTIKAGQTQPPFNILQGLSTLVEFCITNAKELEQQRREKREAIMEKSEEFERERGDFALVNDITRSAAIAPDLHSSASAALERIARRLGVRCAAIFATDSTNQVFFVGDYNLPADIAHTLHKNEGLSSPMILPQDSNNGCAILPIKSLPGIEISPIRSLEEEGLTHCIIIPLTCQDRNWGVIHLYNAGRPRIPNRDKTVLLTISHSLSVILENKRLLDELDDRIKENINYYELSKMLITTSEFDILLENIIWVIHETIDVDHCSIMLADEEGENLSVKALWGYSEGHRNQRMPFGNGVTGWVAENGEAVLIHDVNTDSRYRVNVEGVRSEMTVPLIAEGKVIGVIDCESNVEYAFNEADLRFLTQLSGPASLAILRTQQQTAIARQFILDPVTQAYNRNYFDDYISKHGKELLVRHSCVSMAIVRINNLKDIEAGLQNSDDALKQTKAMLDELYPEAVVSRYSDSEFYILLPGLGEEAMEKLVDSIRRRSEEWSSEQGSRPLSLSAGYATATRFDELESLISRSSGENNTLSNNLSNNG